MKRLLISSVLMVALGFAGIASADGYRGHGHPPGIQKQLERGKALPAGHQKKFLRSEWRQSKYDHRYNKHYRDKHQKFHYGRYDRKDKHRGKYRNSYHDRNRYNRYRDGYRGTFNHHDRLAPEYRAARIIRDTQILIEQSRR